MTIDKHKQDIFEDCHIEPCCGALTQFHEMRVGPLTVEEVNVIKAGLPMKISFKVLRHVAGVTDTHDHWISFDSTVPSKACAACNWTQAFILGYRAR